MNRTITLSAFADEIHKDFIKNRDTNYIFFLGAGCSKSSGIPLAGELALEWYEELKDEEDKYQAFIDEHELDNLKDEDLSNKIKSLYFPLFEILFPDALSRQKEIQRLTEDKYPAIGYYELAQLMKNQAFNTVITTNFDDLIYDALIYSSTKRPRIISHHDLAHYIDRGKTPHIIKLHGDAHLHPSNDSSSTQEIEEPLRTSVVSLLNNTKLIVIGYGGGDESIAQMLQSASRIAQVYWLNASSPEETTLGEWWEGLYFSTFIDEYDFDKIMSVIGNKFKLEKPNFKQFCNTLKFHYDESIDKEIEEDEQVSEETSNLDTLNELVEKLIRLGEYKKAISIAKEAIEKSEKIYGIKHAKTSSTYLNLAGLYQNMDEYDNALKFYEKALIIDEKVHGMEHPTTAITYNNLGTLYERIGRYEKALEFYQKSLNIREKVLGTENLSTATAYANLGMLYTNMNEDKKALEFYEKSLAIDEKLLGIESLAVASTYNNLGMLYMNMKENKKALKFYEKSLAIHEKLRGAEHPDTGRIYSHLGEYYSSNGEYKRALEFYEKSLVIHEKVFGIENLDTATIYNNLGTLYEKLREDKKAQEYYKKSLIVMNKIFPDGNSKIDIIKKNMEGL